ncbi:transcription factor jumonji [Cavenderia fasciculata]|uniref:Transcription factor jumonji n=1 Tax=Cavenderia fasciculata TaxID=261658 RepID=F4QEW6_CACFS|nr:transcription factor jumonji [Cavenderia fasciculata]EGG14173.1 transcription factor jumonji [Cavenderia fasciculata]|eukprot:XP_004350881.1 transcription factor jumonji [Cavenderia fasciculata]
MSSSSIVVVDINTIYQPIFTFIKKSYLQREGSLSSDLRKIFYILNKKQFTQLGDLSTRMTDQLWQKLVSNNGWSHVCLRECYVYSLLLSTLYHVGQNNNEKAIEQLDTSFIMGAPKSLIIPIIKSISTSISTNNNDDTSIIPMIKYDELNIELPKINNQIIILENPTVEYVLENHLKKNLPCVIKSNETMQWPCIEKWKDLNYFINNFGNRLVPIEIGHNKLYKSMDEIGQLGELKTKQPEWSEKVIKMKEFVEKYLVPSSLTNEIPKTSEEVGYLAQHNLVEQIPELCDHFSKSQYLPKSSDLSPHSWFGTNNTITPLHYDSYDNYLTQIVGHKYVRLYEPSQTPNLYIKETNNTSVALQGNMTMLDIENASPQDFPLFAQAKYTETILSPGDMLFIPSNCWHYVRSLSNSSSLSFWFYVDDQ